jgi:hydroxymethylpyrimidine/phosphomethylpyrimidine kinase
VKGRVLIVAGSDSGGGAGIQADIKTVTALGGYAMTAVTAITVQDTRGVHGVHPVPQDIVRAQIDVTLADIGADAIKTGMLGDVATVQTVAQALRAHAVDVLIVVDPVMIAKGGHALLAPEAIATVRNVLLPLAALVTPNAPEAEALAGFAVGDVESQTRAGEKLIALGARAALIKGGHIGGPTVRDVLVTGAGATVFESPRIDTRATHGTGCTLASAIAAKLAQGESLPEAVRAAREYLMEAIRRAPGFGAGHGPVDHAWTTRDRR